MPWYAFVASGWLSGTAIVIGGGVVFGILARKISPLWHPDCCDGLIAMWTERPMRSRLLVALAAFVLYNIVASQVLSDKPLLIDELIEVLQAQILVSGHLWRSVAPHPEFFSSMHIVDMHGRYFSQFPIGGPAMLAIGVLIHAPWIVDPLFGAAAVLAFAAYVHVAEPKAGAGLMATLLFAFAPFVAFMSGSHMNHVTALAWVMIAIAIMAHVMVADAPRPWLALMSGLAFGIAGTIRPVDAFAFALPAGTWYLVRALRDRRRWADALPAAVGVAIPLLILFWVNLQTTGAPLLFGYEELWGKSHKLGFHRAPWGMRHTPARGLELINLYFLRLQTYLFETPCPSLLPLVGALALARRLDRFDRYLLSSSGLLVALYFSYWFDGFYLGPRFMYLLMPAAALWTARFFPLVKERFGTGLAYRSSVYGALTAALIAVLMLVPMRARQYEGGLLTLRWDADSAARAADVQHALVFVRESWGAELVARMWALGVPRSETEDLYRHVDACALEQAVTKLESGTIRDTAALRTLQPLLRDSSRVLESPFSVDTTERYVPGMRYPARCRRHLAADGQGFTLFTPLLLAHGGNNVYARDFGPRDSLLLRRYPNRPVYLLRPASTREGAPPRFYTLIRDSLWASWRHADTISLPTLAQLTDSMQQRRAAQVAGHAPGAANQLFDRLLHQQHALAAPDSVAAHPASEGRASDSPSSQSSSTSNPPARPPDP